MKRCWNEIINQVADLVHNQTSRRLARWGPLAYEKNKINYFFLGYEEKTLDYSTGRTSTEYGLEFGAMFGLGLVIDASLQLPFYRE